MAEPADRFDRVFAKDRNVHLHRLAIGEQAGETTIHASARDDSSSLLPITALQDRLFPGTAEAGTQRIQIRRLADCLTEAEIIQLVPGYQPCCLRRSSACWWKSPKLCSRPTAPAPWKTRWPMRSAPVSGVSPISP